ncbi:hypothetical protein C5L31_000919 [Secundilactobacillus malefermentans]|uniref:Cytoskeleton protein RodZ-like C-terminal domain-containing protein n=2 Tax=Secundilactobacillus malefermentans TaxID=176292 RepID=A0A4R5NIF9_9LACO|nr:Xre-like DNA-binding protein [Secundilactobacillus malefermentans DSM 5705 = KCTC 3548]TDG74352.1 hypothetical protein C5L31_000919 [Secundilactobacillus malefermentans]
MVVLGILRKNLIGLMLYWNWFLKLNIWRKILIMSEKDNVSIGKTLRDARIAKGFTIDDLQQTTKIQKRYLIAIEEERFDDLPGDFYVRAFIKQYADTVDLDGAELLNEFSNKLPNTKTQEYTDKVNENNPTTRSTQRKVDDRYEKLRRKIPMVVAIVVVILVLGGIWYASSLHSQKSSQDNIDSSSVSVSGSSSSTSSSKKESQKKASSSSKKSKVSFETTSNSGSAATLTMKNAPKSKAVTIKTSANAWTSVSSTTAQLWQGTLQSSSHTVKVPTATTQLTFRLGGPSSTTISIGGHKVPLAKLISSQTSSSTSATTSTSSSATTQYGSSSTSSTTTTAQLSSLTIIFK